jgi:hypothetical protein
VETRKEHRILKMHNIISDHLKYREGHVRIILRWVSGKEDVEM